MTERRRSQMRIAAAPAEEVVQRIRAPATEESRGDVRASVDQTLVPLVAFGIWIILSWDAESSWERQIRTV